VCSTQGASRPCARSEANVCVSQSRLDAKNVAHELDRAAPPEPAIGPQRELHPVA
jgi:hypothetical protein